MTVDPATLPNPWAQISGRHTDNYIDHGIEQAHRDIGWLLGEVERLRGWEQIGRDLAERNAQLATELQEAQTAINNANVEHSREVGELLSTIEHMRAANEERTV